MSPDQIFAWSPNLEDAIDRQPLIVSPETTLNVVMSLINQTHRHSCILTDNQTVSDLTLKSEQAFKTVRCSCVLVMTGPTLLGILTERDVVRLTAKAVNFAVTTVAEVMIQNVITLPQQAIQDIFAALFLFRRYRIRHLPIVDHQGRLVGVISHESLRQVLRPVNLLRLRRVSDVMTTTVVQAALTTTVLDLAQLMAVRCVSCVVIMQQDKAGQPQPLGIVTERDIVQFQALQINLTKAQAQTVMSSPLFLLSPEDSLWTAHQAMQKRRIGRLVVSWNWGQGLGIVTQTSLLRVFDPMEMYGVIEHLQQTIQQLSIGASSLPSDNQPHKVSEKQKHSLALLHSAQSSVEKILSDQETSIEQQQFQLKLVLETLEQIDQVIQSSDRA
jgi:signal-transduction protein with cAMP-binding, CBS, and nucleotidyltransferase domain